MCAAGKRVHRHVEPSIVEVESEVDGNLLAQRRLRLGIKWRLVWLAVQPSIVGRRRSAQLCQQGNQLRLGLGWWTVWVCACVALRTYLVKDFVKACAGHALFVRVKGNVVRVFVWVDTSTDLARVGHCANV